MYMAIGTAHEARLVCLCIRACFNSEFIVRAESFELASFSVRNLCCYLPTPKKESGRTIYCERRTFSLVCSGGLLFARARDDLSPGRCGDQAFFMVTFAHGCNIIWKDEQAIAESTLIVKDRRCINFLWIGQCGSGKTALVQETVLPTIDFLFPPDDEGNLSSLIVKWSQAQNISSAQHKAVACHRVVL